MSDNGEQQPAQGPQIQQIPCPNCSQAMVVHPPTIRIQNWPEMSMIVFSHPRPIKCPGCASLFAAMIEGFNPQGSIQFKWAELKTGQSAIIAPSAQQTMVINKEKLPS